MCRWIRHLAKEEQDQQQMHRSPSGAARWRRGSEDERVHAFVVKNGLDGFHPNQTGPAHGFAIGFVRVGFVVSPVSDRTMNRVNSSYAYQ
jgi:hypothetical protein